MSKKQTKTPGASTDTANPTGYGAPMDKSMPPLNVNPPDPNEPKKGPAAPRSGGIFAPFTAENLPRTLQVIAAGLRDMDSGGGNLDRFLEMERGEGLEAIRRQLLEQQLESGRLGMERDRFELERDRLGEGEWSDPFPFAGGMAQRHLRTGQIHVLSRPVRSSSTAGAPSVPAGFVLED